MKPKSRSNRRRSGGRVDGRQSADGEVVEQPTPILQRPFVATLLGIAAYWASFAPLGWSFMAWVAPIPWIALAATKQLPGRRPYVAIWAAATIGWLAILQGVRLPYWALYFGWLALSAYVAIYVPLFIGLTRVAHLRLKLPIGLAAPLVWCGLEWIRGRYPVSFAVALLGHTQVRIPALIQVADIAGAITVSAIIMVVASVLAPITWLGWGQESRSTRKVFSRIVTSAAVIVITICYGQWRLATAPATESVGKVALIQGNFNTIFEYDSDRNQKTLDEYTELAWAASREHSDLSAIVWPESTYTGNNPELHIEGEPALLGEAPSDLDPAQYLRNLTRSEQFFRQRTESLARAINAPYAPTDGDRHIAMIAGTSSHFLRTDSTETYNSALLIQPDGKITDRYYKMHRVLIGEYTPGAEQFEWIQRLTPVEGIRAGTEAKRFEVGGIALMPNICFESTVPQLVRGQLAEAAKGGRVDAIVNMTHDGWFWGSSILDLHMACGVFRAVENRISFLAAANPGITYACDGSGRIQESLTREEKGYLVADVKPDGRRSLYQFWSDWPFGVCAALCLGIGLVGLFPRRATEPVG